MRTPELPPSHWNHLINEGVKAHNSQNSRSLHQCPDCRLVSENGDEVLQLAASLRAGTVPPSVMLKRIGAFPRQNAFHKALQEIGRIERPIFMAD
jgi:TnpA family transposase